jgi:hypothetical protein
LGYRPLSGSRWSLPLSVKRVLSETTSVQTAIEQTHELLKNESLPFGKASLVIQNMDSGYCTPKLIAPLVDSYDNLGLIVRFRHIFSKQKEQIIATKGYEYYRQRYDIEGQNRFSKQRLLLDKYQTQIPRDKLFSVLAAGGQNGTLSNVFVNNGNSYVYGKSGSMSAVYNLSGYLISKKGKTFIFSFMNNNFTKSVSQVRREVERILTSIYESN